MLDQKILERLNQVLGKSETHTKIGIYASGERKEVTGIPDATLLDEVTYDVERRWGRALFVDGKYIYKGYLSEEECLKIEKEFADKVTSDAEQKDAEYKATHCFCEVPMVDQPGSPTCKTCGKTLRPETEEA